MRVELSKLKHEICFEEGTRMLIALSISSDQMLCHVHMFPETWFMDVTANLNRLKRDVIVMVVRDACGKCYVGNLTVIPSGQAWVFMKIYETFFYHLFGPVTIGRNRLAIMDEDLSQFRPFQNLIDTKHNVLTIVTCSAFFMPWYNNFTYLSILFYLRRR